MARKYTISATHHDGAWRFRCTKAPTFGLGSGTTVPPDIWKTATGEEAEAVRLLCGLLDLEGVKTTDEELVASEGIVASWEVAAGELADIGLPPVCPFRLSISSAKPITDLSGKIQLSWLGADYLAVPAVTRSGTWVKTGNKQFLLRDPLRSLADAVETTNAAQDVDERMRQFADVRRLLMDMTNEVVAPDNLKNMIIYQATALKIETDVGPDGYVFSPELLGDIPPDTEDEEPRRVALLNRTERQRFHRELDKAHANGLEEARPSYVLASNTYVVLDPGVRAALKVVRQVSRSDRQTRQAFFNDKYSFLLPALREAGSDGSVVEFSDRVLGVFRWEGGKNLGGGDRGQEWFPDADATTYVIRDARGEEIHIPREKADERVRQIREAFAAGQARISIEGQEYHLNESVLGELARIPTLERPTSGPKAVQPEERRYWFVKPRGNVDELVHVEGRADIRGRDLPAEIGLLNQPKKHQSEGISWLQQGYLVGMRGILMADEMGLGKTFQVLAFLKWLRLRKKDRSPGNDPLFMVVAPKTLLGNWIEEVEIHLGRDGIGSPALVYGGHLKDFRKQGARRDIETGEETLCRKKLRVHDWVLTTYETLRDYQISFAKIGFEVVVFDEAQKIKESSAMVTEAARSQKAAALRILMTGTPVENGLMDLWTLMDVAWPGRLGYSGAEFKKQFVKNKGADLTAIKKLLTEPVNDNGLIVPQLMLRRMKDAVTDLRPKHFEPCPETMPTEQAEAYAKVVEAQSQGSLPALGALQAIRNISLHPDLQKPIDYRDARSRDAFIAMSARLIQLFRILDVIKSKDEKALVFVDLRRAQAVIADLIMHRYELNHRPHVINGETSADSRDTIRKGFQKRQQEFEVLILAPRAAGFGLTLHAANHVVHLNRWWNPAVEDQCTDRAHRLGQSKDVTVWIPIAKHPVHAEKSYDVVLNQLLEEKRELSGDIIVPVQFAPAEIAGFHTSVFGETQLQTDLAGMDWKSFENWAIERLVNAGLVASRTPASGDAGADAIVRLPTDQSRGAVIQVKHRSRGKMGVVTEREVVDALRADGRYSINNPSFVLVTNGSVEPAGVKRANLSGITIVDHSNIGRIGNIVRDTLCGGLGI